MGSQVPVWAEENRARFLRAAKAAGEKPPLISAASVYRSLYDTEALTRAGRAARVEKADGSSMLTTEGRILPPPVEVRPEEAYYRDENNHPDILSTILETARATAGYNPATGGAANTPELASQQHEAFLRFLEEVDKYFAFLTLEQMDTRQVKNSSMDCEGLVSAVADVILAAMGEAGQSVRDRIADTIRAAAERVTRNVTTNSVVDVGYNNVNLPAPTTDRPNRDPATTLCFSIVGMTRTVQNNGIFKGTTDSSTEYLYVTAATYRMRSSSVSAYASYLAGSTIIPAERAIVNFQTTG